MSYDYRDIGNYLQDQHGYGATKAYGVAVEIADAWNDGDFSRATVSSILGWRETSGRVQDLARWHGVTLTE